MTAKTDAQIEPSEEPTSNAPETPGARLAARKAAKAARKAAERGRSPNVPEGVQQQAEQASTWLADNARAIGIGVVALTVLGAGILGIRMIQQTGNAEAALALGKGVKATLAAVVKAEDAAEEDADSTDETFETLEARSNKALGVYREVVSKHDGSDAALWARLAEGGELLTLGKPDEAARAFGAVESTTDDDFMRYRALEGHGFALEAQNKLDEATQKFVELGKIANGAFKPASDFHLARLLQARGDAKGAKEMFSKLVETLGQQSLEKGETFTAIKDEAQLRLEALGGERKSAAGPGVGAEGLTPELLEQLRKQLDLKAPAAPAGQ